MEQSSAADVHPASQSVSGLSWKGLVQVFSKPGEFFEKLKNNPRILVPYIVAVILYAVSFVLISDLLVQAQLESPQMAERMQGQPATPQVRQALKITSIAFPTVFMALYPIVAAWLASFFGGFIMGAKARYKAVLSVILYGNIIFAVGTLIHAALMLAKGSVGVTLSLGVLAAGQGFDSIPFVALSKIGLFNIWEIIAVGIGLAAVYNFPRNKGYWTAVLSIGLISVLHIILTGVGGLLG
ncbi:MAG: YIP1 family protein [Candidatus Zixiibacteriota bacterium]|nr:MAG: YIP1 family protein [candidate division Zixibacteria bacterium]